MWPATQAKAISAVLLLACVCVVGGCADFRVPRVDPTGERIFVPAPSRFEEQPEGQRTRDNVDLIVSPQETIAPVGSEVVLVAGVLGPDQYLSTNERVEWTVDPGGVGEIVQVGQGTWLDLLLLDFTQPKKINNTWAVGSTSRKYIRLTRGTPAATDDVCVQAGQTWVAVSSPAEGTSHVTAYAPSVYGWDRHRETATIHWVDAQWAFPPPAINPAGTRHLFTTTVSRHTDGLPCAGWLVRYEIVEGPPAGFAPDGVQALEVQTDQLGQATVEVFQQQPGPGTNKINIQVIRPAGVNGGGKRLVVGRGSTLKTWTTTAAATAPAVDLKVTGPEKVNVGDQVTFEIAITNGTAAPATGLVIKDSFDAGLEHEAASGAIERPLDDLAPGGFHRIHVTFRAARAGQLCHTVEVRGSEGILATQRVCVTAVGAAVTQPGPQPKPQPQPKPEVKPPPPARPSLSVRISGPPTADVGQPVTLTIDLENTGAERVTDVRVDVSAEAKLKPLKATPGFYEDKSRGLLSITIDAMAPGSSKQLQVRYNCEEAGRAIGRVAVTSVEGVREQAEASVEIRPAQKPPGPALAPPDLTIEVSETSDPVNAGKSMTYLVKVTNKGQTADRNVVVVANVPPEMVPDPLGISGPARYHVDGRTVAFDPMPEFLPGESRTYRIQVLAKTAGSVRFSAQLTSAAIRQAKLAEETTVINPKP